MKKKKTTPDLQKRAWKSVRYLASMHMADRMNPTRHFASHSSNTKHLISTKYMYSPSKVHTHTHTHTNSIPNDAISISKRPLVLIGHIDYAPFSPGLRFRIDGYGCSCWLF